VFGPDFELLDIQNLQKPVEMLFAMNSLNEKGTNFVCTWYNPDRYVNKTVQYLKSVSIMSLNLTESEMWDLYGFRPSFS
jgi:hypothetical protein